MQVNKKNVLIITSTIDGTIDYIIKKYNLFANFYRLNVDLLEHYSISINNSYGWIIEHCNWILCENECHSIYYRKPLLPSLNNYEQKYREMIKKDIISLINGVVDSFEGKVITKPSILRMCENKVFQLQYAKKHEIKIPFSFIGTNNEEASVFNGYKSIIKPLTTGKIYYENSCDIFQTNLFSKLCADISLTPIYLQEYVEKDFEVRLTIVNDAFFPVKILSDNNIDWRTHGAQNIYSLISLPEEIKIQCKNMLKDFGLIFGAFDFIVNLSGDWIFLEVNPNGQWQWLENELCLNISEEIVNYLIT